MSEKIFREQLKSQKLKGTYLFYGEEEYTKDSAVKSLRNYIDALPLPEFNHTSFTDASITPANISEALSAYPYMSDTMLVEIISPDLNKITEQQAAEFAEIIKNVADYEILLIILKGYDFPESDIDKIIGGKLNAKCKPIIDAVNTYGLLVKFPVPTADKLFQWVKRHFDNENIKYQPEIIEQLIFVCGSDMYSLNNEIKKLIAVYDGTPLTADTVLQTCRLNESYQTFDMTDALISGDLKRAIHIYENLVFFKVKPELILGAMSKLFSDLCVIEAGLQSSLGYSEIADKLKTRDWLVRKNASLLSKIKKGALTEAVRECALTDRRMKSYTGDAYIALELLIYKLGKG